MAVEEQQGQEGGSGGEGTTPPVSPRALETIRLELRAAVADLSARGLKLAAKWAAEQLAGLREPGEGGDEEEEEEDVDGAAVGSGPFLSASALMEQERMQGQAGSTAGAASEGEGLLGVQEELSDAFLMAKAYFDVGEYRRAAHTLERAQERRRKGHVGGVVNQEELFLRCYATYLAGEKAKEERMMESADPLDRCQLANESLPALAEELGPLYHQGQLDGFNLYVYGVVLKALRPQLLGAGDDVEGRPSARAVLLEAVCAYTCNWSAWLDLAEVCLQEAERHNTHHHPSTTTASAGPEGDMPDTAGAALLLTASLKDTKPFPPLSALEPVGVGGMGGGGVCLPPDVVERVGGVWVYDFFRAHVLLEQHQSEQAFGVLQRLRPLFPRSPYLLAQEAIAHYNMRDFDGAQQGFQQLREQDPYRLENLERYSDVLYVKESRAELSRLAQAAAQTEKYRPETCCIIGNYYSLKGHHERAVLYFQRALKLNRHFLFAWTLMGHGFLEMKNTGAAIEAYRRAVDINPRDYRAWYGLGQTYELLQMYFYAIYYYRKAATLRPFDARMWCALGVCFEQLERKPEALRCYERAVCNHDREGIATAKLARLYREACEEGKAARCYTRHLEARGYAMDAIHGGGDTADALLFLAHYHKKRGDREAAVAYCNRLLDMGGREQEEAKALLREIRSLEREADAALGTSALSASASVAAAGGGMAPAALSFQDTFDSTAAAVAAGRGGGGGAPSSGGGVATRQQRRGGGTSSPDY